MKKSNSNVTAVTIAAESKAPAPALMMNLAGVANGALLTIIDCFRPALAKLRALADCGLVWANCEALECRHNLGRGTLVVLDVMPASGTSSYKHRRAVAGNDHSD